MREIAISGVDQLQALEEAEENFCMDEESFRAFYEQTARRLWLYLARASGDQSLADDLLQEAYCRFLQAASPQAGRVAHKQYLFRIATNLLRDHWRRTKGKTPASLEEVPEADLKSVGDLTEERVERQSTLAHAFAYLKPRDREILWMAYAEGSSHQEIAEITGLKANSIKLLLFRARRKMAHLLENPKVNMRHPKFESRDWKSTKPRTLD